MTTAHSSHWLQRDPGLQAVLRAGISEVIADFEAGDYRLVVPWPYPAGVGGPLICGRDGPAHGAYVREDAGGLVLCVANNGWPIEVRACPGPDPGPLALLDPTSAWVSQQDTLVGTVDPLQVISAGDAAIDRVISGHKPLAMADTDSADEARLWRSWVESAGLVCGVEEEVFPEFGERIWFVTVARTETFGELVDLDAVGAYYESALGGAGWADVGGRVLRSLSELRAQSPAEFVERTGDLIVAPFGDDLPGGCRTEVAGIVMGYWPPTTAALLLSTVDGTHAEPEPLADLRGWDALRFALADEADHRYDLVPDRLLRTLAPERR